MSRCAAALLLIFVAVGSARAQAPTGAIAGIAMDASGAAVPGVSVSVANRDTGQSRTAITSTEGRYSAEALLPGVYRVSAEIAGFKRQERTAPAGEGPAGDDEERTVSVEAGTTTTVDLALEVGQVSETVQVAGAAPLLRRDQHQVGGLVSRAQIENLPLNGRNFLELAKLEPGVTNPVRLADNRTFVSSLGAGLQTIPRVGYTRVTVDGGSITTPNTTGMLPGWLHWLAYANPFFYFTSGLRHAMIGYDETPQGLGIGLTLLLLAAMGGTVWGLFAKGYGLRE